MQLCATLEWGLTSLSTWLVDRETEAQKESIVLTAEGSHCLIRPTGKASVLHYTMSGVSTELSLHPTSTLGSEELGSPAAQLLTGTKQSCKN